jgi:hypothetical protein
MFLSFLVFIICCHLILAADTVFPLAVPPSSIAACDSGDAMLYTLTTRDAFCIDGTKPVFYLRRGTGEGKAKWIIYFEGGGWCFNLDDCGGRSKTRLGSTFGSPLCFSKQMLMDHMNGDPLDNPLFYNWNVVYVRYCDGSSYASNTVQYHYVS